MAPKPSQNKPVTESKKKRRVINLEDKLKVIKQYEKGRTVTVIARDLGWCHSTVTTILKNRTKITKAVEGATPMKSTIITKQREGPIADMEKLLATWIEDQKQKSIPLRQTMISAKARALFGMLKAKAGPDYDVQFNATSGWFKRFKQRYSLHSIKVYSESASVDVHAAEAFVDDIDKVIVERGYLPHQIFSIGETSLFWKKMPERTIIHKEAKSKLGFKEYKDRITLLLGGNVAGYKLKAFAIWHSENPRAFKNIDKDELPVHYRSNKMCWMSQKLFEDALVTCYAKELENYCINENVPFNILLLVDNSRGHPPSISDLHPNIKVVFLPPHTTSLIQPMDQGVFDVFKANYVRSIFNQAVNETKEHPERTLVDFWKRYNIHHGIKNIASAWYEVPTKCMSDVWKKTLKRFVNDFGGFEKTEEMAKIYKAIVELANSLRLDVDDRDITQLIETIPEELTNEELVELEEQRVAEEMAKEKEEEDEGEHEESLETFTVKGLEDMFSTFNNALKQAEDMDPNTERFLSVKKKINDTIACYRQIYDDKKHSESEYLCQPH